MQKDRKCVEQKNVMEFHEAFGFPVRRSPIIPQDNEGHRCVKLISEETRELITAIKSRDLDGIAHNIADAIYVLYGTALTYGIDMRPIWDEVHRSNMTKIGGKINSYGKLMKPSTYRPPDIVKILRKLRSNDN